MVGGKRSQVRSLHGKDSGKDIFACGNTTKFNHSFPNHNTDRCLLTEGRMSGDGMDSLLDKVQGVFHHDHSRNSSDEIDGDKHSKHPDKFRLFGRQKPVHSALGGGKPADIMLWRNKQISACMLAAATVIWLLFEWIGYRLLPFLCHSLILVLALLFLWSNLSFFVNRSPLELPEIVLPENLCMSFALLLRDRFNQAFGIFRQVASERDVKKFLGAIVALWLVSIVGSWFDLLTLVYLMFVALLTVPLLYEKHEDRVDAYAEKATVKLKKQISALDEKVLHKLPNITLKQR